MIVLDPPPGLRGSGTRAQAAGGWWRADLVRWVRDPVTGRARLKPMPGWRRRGSAAVPGRTRCIFAWGYEAARYTALGSHLGLWTQTPSGVLTNRTPPGFTPGRPDAVVGSGYGGGVYGAGGYGMIRPDDGSPLEATVWSLDSFDGVLVGVSPQDERLWAWDPAGGAVAATAIPGAPRARALFVAPENALVALAADGDDRRVAFSDRGDRTVWTPAVTNKAGDFDLKTAGAILCGRAVGRRSLILTTVDAWVLERRDGLLVYAYDRVGEGCGAVSRAALAVVGREAVWMSRGGFKRFDGGGVAELPCPVLERVFGDLNTAQLTKVVARHNAAEGEVRWSYCSAGSVEVDRQAVWCYREDYWTVDQIGRTAMCDRGVFAFPLSVDAAGGVYEDEVGDSCGGAVPYAVTGPIDLAGRTRRGTLRCLEPDAALDGLTVTVAVRDRASGRETVRGPYPLRPKTPLRATGREAELRFDFHGAGGEVGVVRLQVAPRGER